MKDIITKALVTNGCYITPDAKKARVIEIEAILNRKNLLSLEREELKRERVELLVELKNEWLAKKMMLKNS